MDVRKTFVAGSFAKGSFAANPAPDERPGDFTGLIDGNHCGARHPKRTHEIAEAHWLLEQFGSLY